MTVNLTRIYTRLGDSGETHLGDMSRVPKTHPRIEAYGTVDELNAHIGLALTVEDLPDAYADWLKHIQNDLFDVGADISAPEDPDRERLRVIPADRVAGGALRRGQRHPRPAQVVGPPRRYEGGGAPARVPHGVPARRAAGHRLRRAGQRRGRAVPEPPLRLSVHPQPRGQRRRGAAVGTRPLPLATSPG